MASTDHRPNRSPDTALAASPWPAEGLPARLRQQAAVAELGQLALGATRRQDLLDRAVALVSATLEVELARFFELLPGRRSLRFAAGWGWRDGLVGRQAVPATDESQSGYTLMGGRPVIVPDYAAEARFRVRPELIEHGARSGVSVPVAGRAGPLGVLGADTLQRREFSQDDVHFLVAMANVIGAFLEREAIDDTLRRREERFRSLIENASDGVALFDGQHRVTYVSPQVEDILGFTPEEFVGRRAADIVIPEDYGRAAQVMRRSHEWPGTAMIGTFRFRHRDGTPRVLEGVVVNRLEDPAVRGIVVNFRDVTGRHAAEQALVVSEARFRSAFVDAAIGMALTSPDGRFIRVNAALCAMLGYTEAELLALPIDAITHPEDRAREQERIAPLYLGEADSYAMELRYRHRDGHDVWAYMTCSVVRGPDGEPIHFIGQAQDISDRRAAEQAVRDHQHLLDRAQAVGKFGSWGIAASLEGELVWSSETYRILGVEPAGPLTIRDFADRVYPEDRDRVWTAVGRATAGIEPYNIDFRIVRPDGAVRWIHAEAEVTAGPAGAAPRMNGFIQDITDRRRLEFQLAQSQKLETVGRLAGGVAHDFNNLLTVILTNADFITAGLDRPAPDLAAVRQDIDEVHRAAERAAGLTRQLLAFARKQVVEPQVIDLNALALDLDRMLRRLLGEDIELETRLGARLGRVRADPNQIEQVLVNLAVNARDAMPHGGTLTVETADLRVAADAPAPLGVPPGDWVMLAVRDTGCGLSPEVKAHLFEPFFTTKGPGTGTGLGLATSYGIVSQAGGHILAESAPGKGTVFRVFLPLVQEAVEAPAAGQRPEPLKGSETILLVEDEPTVRRLGVRALESRGYTVIEATNGVEAEQVTGAHLVDLLVTDVVMPRMGGAELAARLQARNPALKVLYTSGYTDIGGLGRGLPEDNLALLQKPFGPEALALRVREMLDGTTA